MRKRLYEIIEADDPGDGLDLASTIYDVFMIVIIFLSILPLAFKQQIPAFVVFEQIAFVIFSIDYLLRLATADLKFKETGIRPFLRYPFSFMAIIDLMSILPSILLVSSVFRLLRVMRLLRAMRVLRLFKVFRYSSTLRILSEVLRESRKPLLTVLSLAVGYILMSALVMFTVESESFSSFFEAIYWATMSLTTVGYGDICPVSVTGRIVTMISSLMGIAIIALPSSIITAGYIRELNRRMEPSAPQVETLPSVKVPVGKTEKV